MQQATEKNGVTFLLDNGFFHAVHDRLLALTAQEPHADTFLRIAMWSAELGTKLPAIRDQAEQTLEQALEKLQLKGHKIQIILWAGSTVSFVGTGFKEREKAEAFQAWASSRPNVRVYLEPYKSAVTNGTSAKVGGVVAVGLGYLGYSWYASAGWGVGTMLSSLSGFLGWGASMHQKLVVCCIRGKFDSIIGGFNLGSEYSCEPNHAIEKEYWHDTAVALAGPAAAVVNNEWVRRWQKQGGNLGVVDAVVRDQPTGGKSRVRIATTNAETGTRENDIRDLMIEHISSAKQSIYIENYAFTDPGLVAALVDRLKKSRIDVVVMVNHPNSQLFEANTTWSYFQANVFAQLQTANRVHQGIDAGGVMYAARTKHKRTSSKGVTYRCWPYPHSKLAIFDDEILVVGSANWTYRSMEYDGEISAFIDDEALVPKLRQELLGHWWKTPDGHAPEDMDVAQWMRGASRNEHAEPDAGCRILRLRAQDFTDWQQLPYTKQALLSSAWWMF